MLKQSQKTMILNHLKYGYQITPLDALNKFGCMRLAAVVKILRDEGYNIITQRVKNKEQGKAYAKYSLIPKRHDE